MNIIFFEFVHALHSFQQPVDARFDVIAHLRWVRIWEDGCECLSPFAPVLRFLLQRALTLIMIPLLPAIPNSDSDSDSDSAPQTSHARGGGHGLPIVPWMTMLRTPGDALAGSP